MVGDEWQDGNPDVAPEVERAEVRSRPETAPKVGGPVETSTGTGEVVEGILCW